MNYLLIAILGYLIGSIPNGLLIGKNIYNVDLRQFGSKNIGATNAFRTLGLWPAFWVFLTDAAKGVIAVYISIFFIGTPIALLTGGIAAIIGHNWSVFLKFTGGRGVATGLGVILVLVPQITAIVFLIWAIIVYVTRYVSLASIVSAVLVPIFMWFWGEKIEFLYFGILAALFVVGRHKPNIERLLKGTELKIKVGNMSVNSKEK
ncbi:glycerol-3-phosphate 1-O-acyltransferase PlsY [Pelosinus propionicus]|uniref:Glycerol-3-phosphate acyltransferase n=1 Tax=Pelosinus propionicus DSM 13327 TaxID=1123291 RepID=A0A1I4H7C8_9FIRM|nr:glycerol-3-phosphate 1-O-acyltransferase PlsY [Pelosinus propionicus]SFL38212.1 glycerol-3-phosphate acyltransferase PlsY [Pelosinus propionicus DSM 13327]